MSADAYAARLSAEIYVDQRINDGRLPESKRQKEIDAIVEQKLSIIGQKTRSRGFASARKPLSFARA